MWSIYDTFSWLNESRLKIKRSHTSPGSAHVRRGSDYLSVGTFGVRCSSDGVNLPAWGDGIKLSAMSAHSTSHTLRHVILRVLHPPLRHQIIPQCCGGFCSSWSQDESEMTDMLPVHNQTGFYWRLQLRFPFFTAHNLTVHRCKQAMASTLITGGAEMIILDIIAHNVWKMICFGYGPLTFYLKGWFLFFISTVQSSERFPLFNTPNGSSGANAASV